METLLILAAIAVAGLALAFAAVMSAQARRPPLRMQREEDLAEGDEEYLIRSLRPAPRSPIDRDGPIVDAEWRDAGTIEAHGIDAKSVEAEMIEARLIEAKSIEAMAIEARKAEEPSQTDAAKRQRGSGSR